MASREFCQAEERAFLGEARAVVAVTAAFTAFILLCAFSPDGSLIGAFGLYGMAALMVAALRDFDQAQRDLVAWRRT